MISNESFAVSTGVLTLIDTAIRAYFCFFRFGYYPLTLLRLLSLYIENMYTLPCQMGWRFFCLLFSFPSIAVLYCQKG